MTTLKNDSLRVPFTKGTGNSLAKAKNEEMAWGRFKRQFQKPHVASCTYAEFSAMGKDAQRKNKAEPGWWMRAPVDKGKRNKGNTQPGVLLSLDGDYFDEDDVANLLSGEMFDGIEHFAHTTFSHTPSEPRYRIVVLCDRKLDPHEYGIVVRVLLAQKDSIDSFDKASKNITQMMFYPGVAKDMQDEYVFVAHPGDPLDVDMLLQWGEAQYGDLKDHTNWPRWSSEDKDSMRSRAAKAEDPLLKKGPVGAWCRTYSIFDLIDGKDGDDAILGDLFEMAGEEHEPNRVNYIPGSGAAGCIIYDDGRFLYSWHDSDPGGNENLNAWDLCRVHLFGDKDEIGKSYTLPQERPSYKAMLKFAQEDDNYRATVESEKFEALDDLYDESDVDEGDLTGQDEIELTDEELVAAAFAELDAEVPVVKRRPTGKPNERVRDLLDMDSDGNVLNTMVNMVRILRYDPRFYNRIGWNEFHLKVCILKTIKSKHSEVPDLVCSDEFRGTIRQDNHTAACRALLQAPRAQNGYDLKVGKDDFEAALLLAAEHYPYHPVIELMSSREQQHPDDGINYMAEFLPELFGTPNDIYHRTIWTNFMIAAVMRVHEPGSKFDFCPVFESGQGLGKSSMVKYLFAPFNGELSNRAMTDEQKAVESMQGHHGMEMAELATLNKAEVEDAKDFLSREKHNVRMAYGRHAQEFLRQTLFIGTTNKNKPLRDPTGNRRFWMIRCKAQRMDFVKLLDWIPKMWAQAYRAYHELRRHQPTGQLDLSLTGAAKMEADRVADGARQKTLAEAWADKIHDWWMQPVHLGQIAAEYSDEFEYQPGAGLLSASKWKHDKWGSPEQEVIRIFATRERLIQIFKGKFAKEVTLQNELNTLEDAIEHLAKYGIHRCITNVPSAEQREQGITRAPRVGGAFRDSGKRQAGFILSRAAVERKALSMACVPWGEAQDADSGTSEPEVDEDDLI